MRTYHTEIILNQNQESEYIKTIGVCRFVYNLFIQKNKELYEKNKDSNGSYKYMNNYDFSKWLNNEFVKNNIEYGWIKDVYSKAVRHSIDNANNAFKLFFKHKNRFPKFKKKGKRDCNFYFVRPNTKSIIRCERHRIKIPILGWCKLKEFGYIPTNKAIISGTISRKANKYYISVNVDENIKIQRKNTNDGIGIDLGIKTFAVLSNGIKYQTLNLKKLDKQLAREQKILSKKYTKNKNKDVAYKNIEKQKLKVQKLYQRIANIRNAYQNKVINDIIKQEPSFITIENLNILGMLKNKHLSKAISYQGFNQFINKLKYKCLINGIELRQVDKFYASSKTCCECGLINKELKLSDRIYKCECGNIIDRDLNASINLKNAIQYKIII